ncbi:hypothetical protein [Clostridium taeniosporum]|uniref:Uncharacterized protein n=1 Tax=Clostridium taeniosporum TaxID=394958 RepID=A0A1D7XIU7_9CLOT|nr:hypothetical protein [Clostridium taeniosporum]AOR23019.1 hypothetical protein BGI42_04485 [Clostridium taeniosporum]
MEENKIKVYIKVDKNNCITQIESSISNIDFINYIYIDEGYGQKYAHAQNYYLDKSLMDMQGRYNYKYEDNKVVELTDEEKEKLYIGEIEQNEEINSDLLDLTEIVVSQQKLIDQLTIEIKTIKGSEKNDI